MPLTSTHAVCLLRLFRFLHTGYHYPGGYTVTVESSGEAVTKWAVLEEGPGPLLGGDTDHDTNTWAVIGVTAAGASSPAGAAAAAAATPFDVTVRIERK